MCVLNIIYIYNSYQKTRNAGISSNIINENVMYDKQSLVKKHVTKS